ncbi:hypothetical protein L6252_02805 [Candidatus Parcubacteria bacterium]|nr:hypothetical protein [Candidatus Parcubacteria bacterium]
MAIIGSIVALLISGSFCFCACYEGRCKWYQKTYAKLGKPDIKSTKELATLWKKERRYWFQ